MAAWKASTLAPTTHVKMAVHIVMLIYESVLQNSGLYDGESPLLCGNITENDKITERVVKPLKKSQLQEAVFYDGTKRTNNCTSVTRENRCTQKRNRAAAVKTNNQLPSCILCKKQLQGFCLERLYRRAGSGDCQLYY